MTSEPWRAIQGLRAAPTGLAADDEDRKNIFTAALNQAEELAHAAAAVSYAARPLLQFYALSQAARAIVAARLADKAEVMGHGLGFSFVRDASSILKSTVAPPKNHQTRPGAFQDVALATGSPGLVSAAELGALWAGNPDLRHVPIPQDGRWVPALSCALGTRPERNADAVQNTTGGTVIAQLELPGETGADLDQAIARYPTLDGCRALRHDPAGDAPAGPDESVGRVVTIDGRLVVTVARETPRHTTLADYWKLQDDLYSVVEADRTYPQWPHPHLVGHVQPSIAGESAPSPLMLWWSLLLGLSSLARYHPAAWVRAIDLDESRLAAPLREVLDAAVEQVPVRVLEALRLDP